MTTRSPRVTPVRYGWEELLDQKIDILKEAIHGGNVHLLAAIQVQDRLSDVDHVATFRREAEALGPIPYESSDKIMEELENRLLEMNNETKTDTDKTGKALRAEADKNNSDYDEWQTLLYKQRSTIRDTGEGRIESLRDFAKERIRQLPRSLRPSAAYAFNSGAAIAHLVQNDERWLDDAMNHMEEWMEDPKPKMEQWTELTGIWHDDAKGTIKRRFGDHVEQFGDPCSSCSSSSRKSSASSSTTAFIPVRGSATQANATLALERITAELEKVGLDKFVLVRKGDHWVVQVEL